jgi:hypothetical protein
MIGSACFAVGAVSAPLVDRAGQHVRIGGPSGRPTALVVILIAILLLGVLGLIELIGRPPAKPATADQP